MIRLPDLEAPSCLEDDTRYAGAMNLVFAFVYRDNAKGTESLLTLRWREVDSNFRFRARYTRFRGFVVVPVLRRNARLNGPALLPRGGNADDPSLSTQSPRMARNGSGTIATRASVRSSGRPSHHRSSVRRKGLSSSPAASANSVAHERNFMSSGEPKIAWSDAVSLSRTVRVQRSSRAPNTGWAR
jgi:hypothetical protein